MSEWREQSKDREGQVFRFQYTELNDIIRRTEGQAESVIVVLDHITDVGNLGALIRSAEVVGAAGVVLPSRRSAQVNEAVFRTSAGAVEHIPVAQVANIVAALARLKDAGFWVAAVTEQATQTIWQAPLEGRLVLVMGAEDSGIARLVRESCDFECRLPQFGRTESLNVAQAATAVLYEWRRRACAPSS